MKQLSTVYMKDIRTSNVKHKLNAEDRILHANLFLISIELNIMTKYLRCTENISERYVDFFLLFFFPVLYNMRKFIYV